MDLDLQSLLFIYVHSWTYWQRPRNPPPPFWGSYSRALSFSQDRRHLFLIPWANCTFAVCTYDMLLQACLEALEVLGLVDPGFNKWRGRLLTELNKARLYLTGQCVVIFPANTFNCFFPHS
jgi:hypothetical protein